MVGLPRRDLPGIVVSALESHPSISRVRLAGSRARGEAVELSDWDFELDYTTFAEIASALPDLVEPLEPIARQWDRLSPFPTYMLMLRGPVKVDLLFPREQAAHAEPWTAASETLFGIDDHFWDWALWLASKGRAGRTGLVQEELGKLFIHLLEPMGAAGPPASIAAAVSEYTALRDALERRLGVTVPRRLDDEVRPALRRAGHAV